MFYYQNRKIYNFLINNMIELQGTGVALITPFKKDLSIDFQSLDNLIDFNLNNGINYFVLLGTTAETATLNNDEKKSIINFIINKVNNKIPLILGMGSNNTLELVKNIKQINTKYFSALLSVCPYYNKPTQEGIYQHYKYIATNTDLPIIMYNVPGRTVINIDVNTTLHLAKNFSNIIAIKEASPNFIQSLQIIKNKPPNFIVLSGDDDLANAQILAGASGVISVIAQAFPKEFSQMIHYSIKKNAKASYKIYYQLLTLMLLIFQEGSPSGIKSVLHHLGIIDPYLRLPLIPISKKLNEKIVKEMEIIRHLSIT